MIPAWHRVFAACLALAAGRPCAQGYPNHAVRLVVPYGPGSSPDSVGRVVAREMQEALGQPVIVANVAGALANVGTAEVARAAPDGYTILLTTNTPHAANVALFKSLPFDPVKDFAPIVRLITTSMVLLVRSDFPASTLKDFIAHARSKPNGLSAGYGSAATIVSIAKLRTAGGFKTLDVPYKGVPLAITDVLCRPGRFHARRSRGVDAADPGRQDEGPRSHLAAAHAARARASGDRGDLPGLRDPHLVRAGCASEHAESGRGESARRSSDEPRQARGQGEARRARPRAGAAAAREFAAFIKQEIAKWTRRSARRGSSRSDRRRDRRPRPLGTQPRRFGAGKVRKLRFVIGVDPGWARRATSPRSIA